MKLRFCLSKKKKKEAQILIFRFSIDTTAGWHLSILIRLVKHSTNEISKFVATNLIPWDAAMFRIPWWRHASNKNSKDETEKTQTITRMHTKLVTKKNSTPKLSTVDSLLDIGTNF